ncbi:DUF1266 domain-containing protein [Chitinophaga ginsengisoli]|uniref:Uncharacterized protein DUF1266 n=1 Tax=Chitinophaga ginsengisoli TaxID=363837 RepID=A0A2P8G2R7_9BACT|nr:DUF1266 domain-containing protein [Chitinophaga ginsengisoli]PSL28273.1 uncharacterized protein DUF1266 [Chitinophaga ginsengisoli]
MKTIIIIVGVTALYILFVIVKLIKLNRRAKEIALRATQDRAMQPAEEEDTTDLHEDGTLSLHDRQYIACGANLAYLHGDRMDTLETDSDQEEIRGILKREWHINTRDKLLNNIDWLVNHGHRVYFKPIWNILTTLPVRERAAELEKLQQEFTAKGDEISVDLYASNISEGYKHLREEAGCFEGKKCKLDALTWDLGRAINLCRWGYDAGFLSRDEAIGHIRKYGKELLHNYTTWTNLGENYLMGFAMWSGDLEQLDELYGAHCDLLSEDSSPWVLLESR